MLKDEVDLYSKLTGKDGLNVPVGIIGAYLDGYERGKADAQPERIKGHWIESAGQNILLKKLIEKGETWRVCDKCGAGFMIGYQYECDKAYHETFHNFCPKCGADMREVNHESN